MENGLIVFLNGTSSSGKTSISKELLKISNHDFLYLSVDDFAKGITHSFVEMFPKFNEEIEENQNKANEILTNPLVNLYYATIKYFALTGKRVIVDSVIESKYWMNECLELMKGLNVVFVGVQCPLDELERRELARGDRNSGLAKSQYDKVHSHGDYDMTVNTFDSSIHDCAMEILTFINSNKVGSAFRKIKQNLNVES